MKARAFKRVWGKPWDFAYLLELEQHKIREMCNYFKKHHHLMSWQLVIRDMEICLKLIDIVLEKDKHYQGWLDANYNQYWIDQKFNIDRKDRKYNPFSVYVNIKNSRRFLPLADFNCDSVKLHPRLMDGAKISLRQKKAIHLYNKIRAYRMECWWD